MFQRMNSSMLRNISTASYKFIEIFVEGEKKNMIFSFILPITNPSKLIPFAFEHLFTQILLM